MKYLLLLPLGLYEILVLTLAYLFSIFYTTHPLAMVLFTHAQTLPSLDWYKS